MTIDEIQEIGKNDPTVSFSFTDLNGRFRVCSWLDPHFGFFEIDGAEGFATVKFWKEIAGNSFEFKLND